jgi:hypothetical protein
MTTWADIVKGNVATTDINLFQGAAPAPEIQKTKQQHHPRQPTPEKSSILPPPATPPTLATLLPSIHPKYPLAVDKHFGDDRTTKIPKTFCFLFNNINALSLAICGLPGTIGKH